MALEDDDEQDALDEFLDLMDQAIEDFVEDVVGGEYE